jgi:hypothetical protein
MKILVAIMSIAVVVLLITNAANVKELYEAEIKISNLTVENLHLHSEMCKANSYTIKLNKRK